MKTRPLLVILISILLIAVGVGGLIQHNGDIRKADASGISIAVSELVAITAGVFMLLRHNWARWLAMFWAGAHVIIGALHDWARFATHIVVFAVFAFALFHRHSRDYFEPPKPGESSLAT